MEKNFFNWQICMKMNFVFIYSYSNDFFVVQCGKGREGGGSLSFIFIEFPNIIITNASVTFR